MIDLQYGQLFSNVYEACRRKAQVMVAASFASAGVRLAVEEEMVSRLATIMFEYELRLRMAK